MFLDISEPLVKYRPDSFEVLTCDSNQRTVSGGKFDWGGLLPKSNGGARRSADDGRKPSDQCNGISRLDCKRYISSRCESRS